MSDELTLEAINVVQDGLFHLDICNSNTRECHQIVLEPKKFLVMLAEALPAENLALRFEGEIKLTSAKTIKTFVGVLGCRLRETHTAYLKKKG